MTMTRSQLRPLAAALLATALNAMATPITVNGEIRVTLGSPYFGVYLTSASQQLNVTPTGSIVTTPPSTGIQINGDLDNFGTIRAAFGDLFGEGHGGLILGGSNSINQGRALIEAHYLGLGQGAMLRNRGQVVTGAFTLDDGRLVTHSSLPAITEISETALVVNEFAGGTNPSARWTSHGDVRLAGTFTNEQIVEIKRNPELINGPDLSPYGPTFSIGTLFTSSRQPALSNFGAFTVHRGTLLRNDGYVFNSGTLALYGSLFNNIDRLSPSFHRAGILINGGTLETQGYTLNRGEVTNTGRFTVLQGGWWVDEGSFINAGTVTIEGASGGGPGEWTTDRRADNRAGASWAVAGVTRLLPGGWLANDGQLTIDAGGLVEVAASSFLSVGPDGRLSVAGRLDLAGGLSNAGVVEVTGHGPSGGMAGTGTIDNGDGWFIVRSGGQVEVRDFKLSGGALVIEQDARLTTMDGRLTMTGGWLSGNGTINGDFFGFGSRPVDPADPACRVNRPLDIACFTPGASPGHIDISGNLTLGEGAVLELEIERDAAGVLHWDTVTAGSISFLQGAVIRVLVGDTAPGAGIENLQFLNCLNGPCDVSAASLDVRGGQGSFFVAVDGSLGFALAPVPEPAAWALMLGGMAALGWRARRRPVQHSAGGQGQQGVGAPECG